MLSSSLTMLFKHLGSSLCHQSEHYVITLTLRSAMGIQSDVNEQLIRETKVTSLEEWQKYYVIVLFDEVK